MAAIVCTALAASAAHAQPGPWTVVRGEGACTTGVTLTARGGPPTPLALRHDGETLTLAFAPPPGAALSRLQIGRTAIALESRAAPAGVDLVADRAFETALAKGKRIRLVWTRGRPAEAPLAGAAAALEALKDCAEPFRLARLPRLELGEAAAVGVAEGENGLARNAALAEAQRLYQAERLAAFGAGGLVPEPKTFVFQGQAPIVCEPTADDFVCR